METLNKVRKTGTNFTCEEIHIPLCHNVTNSPSSHLVSQLLRDKFHTELTEILAVGWSMETKLHGHLNHHSAEHESWVCRSATGGKWPCTEQAKRFDDMITLRYVCQSTPHEPCDWSRQRVQQTRITLIASGTNADHRPKKQRRVIVIVVGRLLSVQKWEERMVVCEKPITI